MSLDRTGEAYRPRSVEPLNHAVTTVYSWPVAQLRALLDEAGFQVLSTDQRADPGSRPHAAIVAQLR